MMNPTIVETSAATRSNNNNTTTRQRNHASRYYSDDPDSTSFSPAVRLESFTQNGYGPSHSMPNNGSNGKENKSWWRNSSFLPWNAIPWSYRKYLFWRNNNNSNSTNNYNNYNNKNNNDYYEDDFNDYSWNCTVGTSDEHGIWLNRGDAAGTIMSVLVWFLIGYSALTITFLAETGGIPCSIGMAYNVLASMALACHVKTTLTDPGSVPSCAVPTSKQRATPGIKLCMCSQCQTFKPPLSHHCRICNRCISRMDHHCPWMNNCIGSGNMKHFVLFLLYTWVCSVFSLLLLGWNYFFCASDECMFTFTLIQLVRIMTLLSVGAFLFTSSMLMNVCYGLMTGIGTIDRLKKKATNVMSEADDEPIPLRDVFGIGPVWTWVFPVDPVFPDFDRIMGYSTPQRLLREQMYYDKQQQQRQRSGSGGNSQHGSTIQKAHSSASSSHGGSSSVVNGGGSKNHYFYSDNPPVHHDYDNVGILGGASGPEAAESVVSLI